ncbi:MAG: response regulator transcription factor [Verrucomicrobia bacterium]|nr:response regulator transcription factor [Verrucomicrobiota bacterium]
MQKQRILIVDDHPLLRAGLIQFIDRQKDMICCGEADGAASTQNAVLAYKPDLVLLDLRLRGEDGLELIKSLKSQHPKLLILVISQCDEMLYAERALRAGARGYIMKEEATEEVLFAIRAVLGGELYLSRKLAIRLVRKTIESRPLMPGPGVESLTDRELQVFQLLGSGLSTRQIAERLNLSFKTIETYRENIKHKLGLGGAADLVRYATRWVEGSPVAS